MKPSVWTRVIGDSAALAIVADFVFPSSKPASFRASSVNVNANLLSLISRNLGSRYGRRLITGVIIRLVEDLAMDEVTDMRTTETVLRCVLDAVDEMEPGIPCVARARSVLDVQAVMAS